jgi:hypothetical protein
MSDITTPAVKTPAKRNAKSAKSAKSARTRKALAPDVKKGDTRPREVAPADRKTEKELLALLVKARDKGDRQAGKKIRRALRRLGHWGGLRLNTSKPLA